MIAEFSALTYLRVEPDGAMLFQAKAGTYTVDGGIPDMLKGEDVTVRYSAEKWDALRLKIVEENETTVVVAGDTGPRFSFPRRFFEQPGGTAGLPPCFPMKLN